jgi:hypothetical protein
MERAKALPRWLIVQRAALIAYGALGVLLLVYALGFITNVYLFFAYGDRELNVFYREMQGINIILLRNAIIIIITALIFMGISLARNAAGIITVLVTMVLSAFSAFLSVNAVRSLNESRLRYSVLDLSSLDIYIERGTISYTSSALTYNMGMALYALFICVIVFLLVAVFSNACVSHETAPCGVPEAAGKDAPK